jgi:hypothetical protein
MSSTIVSRWRRVATGLATALLAAAAVAGSASPAAADTAPNSTPATAVGFASVPYEDYGAGFADNPAATDPTAQRVAAACNGGADIYGTSWWKYTASSQSTFVVHAASAVGGPSVQEPIGMAVVAADLNSVLKCGTEGTSISDAGAFSRAAGGSLYIVTYFAVPTDNTPAPPMIGVYPSTGVVPTNDNYASARPVTTFPFSATQDTTLATREATEPVCYSKFGVGPSVWYSVTVPRAQRLDVAVSSDYGAMIVVASSVDDQSTWNCDGTDRLQFFAEASVTYRIGLYGVDEVRNAGRATLTVGQVPEAPKVQLSIAPIGRVEKKTGVVYLSGQAVCSGTTATDAVTGTISQEYRRQTHSQTFTGTTAACTGKSATWTAVVHPSDFRFTTGQVKVTASVNACNSGGCTAASATANVTLKAR